MGQGGVGVVKTITHSHGGRHAVTTSSLSGTLSCGDLEALWKQAGGDPSAAFLAAEVAKAESGGRQYARDPATGVYKDGTVDEGYWQINTVHGNATYDPLGNAKAAVAISSNGTNWHAWVTYNKGLEVGQC